jgi:hypothetical protein
MSWAWFLTSIAYAYASIVGRAEATGLVAACDQPHCAHVLASTLPSVPSAVEVKVALLLHDHSNRLMSSAQVSQLLCGSEYRHGL